MILDCMIVRTDGSVEGAQLTGHEVVAAERDPSVLALAPLMPLRPPGPVLEAAPPPSWAWTSSLATGHDGAGVTVAIVGRAPAVALAPEAALIRRDVFDAAGHATTLQLAEALADVGRFRAQVALIAVSCDVPGAIAALLARGYSATAAMATAVAHLLATIHALGALIDRLTDAVVIAPVGDDSDRRVDGPGGGTLVPAAGLVRLPTVLGVGAVALHRAGLIVAPSSNLYPALVAPGGAETGRGSTVTAASYVAGFAAQWWQALGPAATAAKVRAALIAEASTGAFAATPDPADVGAGLVQPPRPSVQGSGLS